MVDALLEAWRVLVPNGRLVDLRPVPSSSCPIEAVTRQRAVQIGEVDASAAIADDLAADEAIRHLVTERRFLPHHEAQFDFEYYWDTVDEMAGFLTGSRRMGNFRPSCAELAAIHRKAETGSPARVRATRPILLAVYVKTMVRPPVRHRRRETLDLVAVP